MTIFQWDCSYIKITPVLPDNFLNSATGFLDDGLLLNNFFIREVIEQIIIFDINTSSMRTFYSLQLLTIFMKDFTQNV